jgi:hypothetical protein
MKRIAIFGLAVIAGWAIWKVVHGNQVPNGYRGRNVDPADWVYPVSDTVDWVTAIAIELLVLVAALAPGKSAAGRAIVLGALSAFVGIVLGPLGMHGTLGYAMHVFWLVLGGAWLVVVGTAGSFVARERKPELPTATLR